MFQEANVTVQTKNFEKALHFYQNSLNFRLGFRNGNDWAELSMNGLTLGLSPTENELAASEKVSVGLNVSSLETAMKGLADRGIVFTTDILDRTTARVIFFQDPDGNPLYLCEVKRPFPTF